MASKKGGRDDELAEFERLASGILVGFETGRRKSLLMKVSLALRQSQARRKKAQIGPDGEVWAPRRPRKESPAPRPIRFLYRKPGAAEPRIADLRSWRRDGPWIIGYDREAGGIRTFLRTRIERHLPPSGGSDPGQLAGSLRERGGRVRRKPAAMFARLRAARNLKAGADPSSAWVEFTDRASRVARVHHYGLRDRVAPGGPEIRYPQRELLGFSMEDREAMLTALLDHVTV